VREGGGREPAPLAEVEAAGPDRVQDLAVPGRVDDDRDARIMAGPPTSICSTRSSPRTPAASACRNG
jgi:hypothetical protein